MVGGQRNVYRKYTLVIEVYTSHKLFQVRNQKLYS